MVFGFIDDIVRKPQLLGNSKGVAFAGNADEQPVSGLQGLHVKFTAGILHAGRGKRKYLQFAIVGGSHGAALHVVEEGEDGDGQGRAFRGICPGSQFIKQAEGVGISFI